MESQLLLPALYLPPVSYFHVIHRNDSPIVLDQHEHFPKQTYRTRTTIGTANGRLDLIVPIVHGRRERRAMKDTLINYEFDWQRLHWLSLQTAYRSSAYFEFYEDDFAHFYEKKFEYLMDFNVQQLELVLKCLKINRVVSLSESFHAMQAENEYRTAIHPKKSSVWENHTPYYQVFESMNGFIPDLSIIDLLFNQGPQSKSYL